MKKFMLIIIVLLGTALFSETITFDINDYTFSPDSLTVSYKEKVYKFSNIFYRSFPVVFEEINPEEGYADAITIDSYDSVLIDPDLGIDYFDGDTSVFGTKFPKIPVTVGARGIKRHGGFSILETNPFFISNDSLFFINSVNYSIVNVKESSEYLTKTAEYSKLDLVIITTEEFVQSFEVYKDFKVRQGFITEIKTIEEIYSEYPGESEPVKIRNYIRDKYLQNDLEYVILGGGYSIIPVGKAVPAGLESDLMSTDAFYSHLDGKTDGNGNGLHFEYGDGPDNYSDVYSGRFPGNNVSEIEAIISKTIKYYSADRNFRSGFNTSSLLLGFNVFSEGDGRSMCEDSRDEFPITFQTDTIYENISPDFSRNGILGKFNLGYNFIYSQSHGDYHTIRQVNNNFKIWSDDILSSSAVSGLYLIGACKPGSYSNDSFSRKAMISPEGGCVNYIGSDSDEFIAHTKKFISYIFKGLNGGLSYGKSLADARIIFGDINTTLGSTEATKKYLAYAYNLQGDPSNKPFLSEPMTINISSISSFKKGKYTVNGTFSTTPNDTVFVTLSSGTEILAKTKATGSNFSLSYDDILSDSVTFSYYSQECFLRTYRYPTVTSNDLEIEISGVDPSDDNGSGIVEHGEYFGIGLNLNVKANPDFIDSLRAKITSVSHSGVSVISDSVNFKLPKTGVSTAFDLFEMYFHSNDSIVSDSVAVVDIEIQKLTGAVMYAEKLFIPVSVPRLELESYKLSGSTFSPRLINPAKGRIDEAVISLYESKNPVSVLNINGYSDIYDSLEFQVDTAKTYTMSFQINGDKTYHSDLISFAVPGAGELRLYGDHSIGKINLEWECSYPDVKGYNIYTSSDESFTLPQKRNFELINSKLFSFENTGYVPVYARIAPVDQNGYEFIFSDPVFIEPFGLYGTGTFKVADFECYNPVFIEGKLITATKNSAAGGINSDGSLISGTGVIHQPEAGGFYGVSDMQGYAVGDVTGNGNDNMVNYLYKMGDSTLVKVIDMETGLISAQKNVYGFVMENAPVLADHDGDGALEILMSVFNGNIGGLPKGAYVYMLKHVDGNLEIAPGYPLFSSSNSYYVHSPSVVDMNDDGVRELIFDNGTKILVYNFETGIKITEYTLPRTVQTSLSFCDYDSDGIKELFALTESDSVNGKLFGLTFDGSILSEVPVISGGINVGMKTAVLNDLTPPVNFADVDNDGSTEIIVVTALKLYIFNDQFGNYPNFPVTLDPRITKNNSSPPSLADLDGDGYLDILFTDANYRVWCYSGYSGGLLPGFPLKIMDMKRNELNSMAVADMDSDGTLEFAVGVNDGVIVVYDYPYMSSDRSIFDNYRGDLRNSGIFNLLTAPQNVSVTSFGTDITITWDAVNSASSYKIYSSDEPYSNFVYEGETSVTSYTIYSVSEPRKFYYVKAVK
ncbi:MAG: hypothetical protein JXN63_03085 [Candidatus Delongbacteria bacterium]|nr:hypothetical protein [Candidatus Delongbacteria bacterium]